MATVKVPRATKTQMIQFLKDRGYDIPHTRKAEFSKYRTSFWLDWEDSNGTWHRASSGAAGGRAYFMVDRNCIDFKLEDVMHYKMFREKEV